MVKSKAKIMQPVVSDDGNKSSVDFLLAEYERLGDLQTEIGQRASRRFEFYLTITSGLIGAFLLLAEIQDKITTPQYVIELTAFALLIYGIITFANLSFASAFQIQIIRAYKQIQKYFEEHDPHIGQYLYFHAPATTIRTSYRFLGVLARGLAGGSEKTIIVLINSFLEIYLAFALFESRLNNFSSTQLFLIGTAIFLASCIIHALYLTMNYRMAKEVW
jgi:hypothetical protein